MLLRTARELNKQFRKINKQLIALGYDDKELPARVSENIDFARANCKANIYNQAVLEGVATSFPQTEEIIDNGYVNGVAATDVQKILNLKHAWDFILDKDALQSKSNYNMLSNIAIIVNEGFFFNGGRIRGVPVPIGGCSYVPPLPIENIVKEEIELLSSQNNHSIDIAIELCLYCMKTQIFTDGNKLASIIFANHFLISKGMGFLVIHTTTHETVVMLSDQEGELLETIDYSDYGITSHEGYGYKGERKDETGLIYLRNRTYNPNTSTFIQQDTYLGEKDWILSQA